MRIAADVARRSFRERRVWSLTGSPVAGWSLASPCALHCWIASGSEWLRAQMSAHKQLLGGLPDVVAQPPHRSTRIARTDRIHKVLVFGGDVTLCAPKRHRPATVEFRRIAQRLGNRHQARIGAPLEQRLMKYLVGPRPVVGDALGIRGIHLGRALKLVVGRYNARLPAKVSMLDGQANHDRLDLAPRLGQMLQISDGHGLNAKALLRHRFDQAFGDQAGNRFTYDAHAGPVIIR